MDIDSAVNVLCTNGRTGQYIVLALACVGALCLLIGGPCLFICWPRRTS